MEEVSTVQQPPVAQSPANPQSAPGQNLQQQIIINQTQQKNGVGTTGFVFSLVALFLGWIPVLGWVLWAVGAICSLVGVFRQPKGLSIAGLVISFIGVIILLLVVGSIASIAAFS